MVKQAAEEQWGLRANEDDIKNMSTIRRKTGIKSKTEAIRFALQFTADKYNGKGNNHAGK